MDQLLIDTALERVRAALEAGQVEAALAALADLHPADRAETFSDLPRAEQEELLPRLDPEDAAELLEEADILCLSASTLSNRSLEHLLPTRRPDRVIILEGPSGGVLPGPLFERGITHLVHNPIDVDFVTLCHRFSRQNRQGLQKITSGRFIDIILPEQRTVTRL